MTTTPSPAWTRTTAIDIEQAFGQPTATVKAGGRWYILVCDSQIGWYAIDAAAVEAAEIDFAGGYSAFCEAVSAEDDNDTLQAIANAWGGTVSDIGGTRFRPQA
jgi:hypothetical protein